jgi:hypothetical protein
MADKLFEEGGALGMAKIETDAEFVPIHDLEVQALATDLRKNVARIVPAAGSLDLHDLRAHIS